MTGLEDDTSDVTSDIFSNDFESRFVSGGAGGGITPITSVNKVAGAAVSELYGCPTMLSMLSRTSASSTVYVCGSSLCKKNADTSSKTEERGLGDD